jgi:hypothetical protein
MRVLAVLLAASFLGLATGRADACTICLPYPKESLADRLLAARAAVLAREDPDRPFHFAAVETLKGKPEAPLDPFLDSTTRRRLRLDPDLAVLLVEKDGWRRLALVDAELRAVLDEILERAPSWKGNDRFDYFRGLLTRENVIVRDLAHLEVARAPYAYLRGVRLPNDRLRAALADRRYAEWRALHILLLAQSGDEKDRARIAREARTGGGLHLAAWATAYVEVSGEGAVGALEARALRGSPDEACAILAAFSVQGRDRHRERIVKALRALLENKPELAPAIAPDLLAWRRWECAGAVERAVERAGDSLAPADVRKLRWFVALAKGARR